MTTKSESKYRPKEFETRKLFYKKYLYKIVLRMSNARFFRNIVENPDHYFRHTSLFRTPGSDGNVEKLKELAEIVRDHPIKMRVEGVLISIYTNSNDLVNDICAFDPLNVKYIYRPSDITESLLTADNVFVKDCQYGFKVILGPTKKDYVNFLEWADDDNSNVELSLSARNQLSLPIAKAHCWIYVKDEKALLFVKMFLGEIIIDVLKVVSS